ncbi:MAG: PEP-CTERM sorting domain-containing protein [bacterium]|nr:PEP-CTERM sorting domain-containing protein [bacterium]
MNITNNPDFADPGALFYALNDGAPGIDRGADIYSITNNCGGNPRPYGGGWDMGAYEFVPEPGSALLLALTAIYNLRLTIGRRRKNECTRIRFVSVKQQITATMQESA